MNDLNLSLHLYQHDTDECCDGDTCNKAKCRGLLTTTSTIVTTIELAWTLATFSQHRDDKHHSLSVLLRTAVPL